MRFDCLLIAIAFSTIAAVSSVILPNSACTPACQNGGSCFQSTPESSPICSCPGTHTGPGCEVLLLLPICSPPCQNGGSCIRINSTNGVCACPSMYTGFACEMSRFETLNCSGFKSINNGNYTFSWFVQGDTIAFSISAFTSGFVGIGFNAPFSSSNTLSDTIIAGVTDEGSFIYDGYFTGSPGSILPFADTISNIHDISVGQFGSSHNPITVFRFSRQRNTGDPAHDVSLDQPVVVLFAFGGEILSISPPNFTSPNAIVTTNVLNFPDSRACPAPSSRPTSVTVSPSSTVSSISSSSRPTSSSFIFSSIRVSSVSATPTPTTPPLPTDCSPQCQNGGSCFLDGINTPICLCPGTHSGSACEIDISDNFMPSAACSPPCQNGGSCVQVGSSPFGAFCSCPIPYFGQTCQLSLLDVIRCQGTRRINGGDYSFNWHVRGDSLSFSISARSALAGIAFIPYPPAVDSITDAVFAGVTNSGQFLFDGFINIGRSVDISVDNQSNIFNTHVGHSGPSSNPSVFFTFERQRHTGDLLHDVSLNQSVVIAFGYGGEILGINPPNFTEIVNGSISEPLQFPDAKACPVLSSSSVVSSVTVSPSSTVSSISSSARPASSSFTSSRFSTVSPSMTPSPTPTSTPSRLPSVIPSVGVSTINGTTVSVSWLPPSSGATVRILTYRIVFRARGSSSSFVMVTGSITSHVLTNLQPETTYDLQIAAVNRFGVGRSVIVTFTTPGAPNCPQLSCRTPNGQVIGHMDTYSPTPCQICICKNGQINCTVQPCNTTTCPFGTRPVKRSDECCPRCQPVAIRCPTTCSHSLCRKRKNSQVFCSLRPGSSSHQCQVTTCAACYYSSSVRPRPSQCGRCDTRDPQCIRRFGTCVASAFKRLYGNGNTRTRANLFKCISPLSQ